MHKNKTEAIYHLLGCNNSDIARVLECSPSDISRIRTGSRVYKPTSRPVLRFADGIYLYADRNGRLNSLCKLCGAKPGSREKVVPQLIAWLFDANEALISDFSYIEQRTRSLKKQKSLFFGEKLGSVMELTSVSNMRLARAINTDVSVISRFRSGLRKPKAPIDGLLSAALYDRAEKQNKLTELSLLCGIKDRCIDPSSFSDWLYGDTDVDIGSIDKLLDSIERFSIQKITPTVDPSEFVSNDITSCDKAAYMGIDGLREAVLRFLFDAAQNGGELYLYSDQDMAWMVSDPVYLAKWKALMTACIKSGVRIRIIHNIDRGSDEMLEAIQSWMPLYITGMIEPFVCHLGRDNRFAKTVFIRKGASCIVASVLRGKEDIGYYEYVTAAERIRLHTSEFDALIANSSPLLTVFFHDHTVSADNSSFVKGLIPALSLGSIPEDILRQMTAKAELTKKECEDILHTYRKKKECFDKLSDGINIIEFICLPSDEERFAGEIRLSVPKSVCSKDIFYTPEEYGAHIAAIMELMERHANYDVVLLPEMPFRQLQIVATETDIAVTRTVELHIEFVFSEPRLLRSFSEYFTMLEEQYRTDKSTAKRSLMRFL